MPGKKKHALLGIIVICPDGMFSPVFIHHLSPKYWSKSSQAEPRNTHPTPAFFSCIFFGWIFWLTKKPYSTGKKAPRKQVKLLLISINFTPKNSHSCLNKLVLSYVFQVVLSFFLGALNRSRGLIGLLWCFMMPPPFSVLWPTEKVLFLSNPSNGFGVFEVYGATKTGRVKSRKRT